MSYVEKVQLRLQHDDGIVDGKQKFQNKTYSKIKTTANNTDLLSVSNAIGALAAKPVLAARKIETTKLEP